MAERELPARRNLILGALAGVLAPLVLVVVLVVVTAAERPYLDRIGWSAIHRTAVEWPSLLALGHLGWLVVATFIVCGCLGFFFALSLARSMPTTSARLGAWFLALVSLALAGVAFKADPPGSPASWHGRIHNDVYPIIPAASIGAAALLAFGLRRLPRWGIHGRLALMALCVIALALALTNIADIAQLARYFLFGALLVWLETLALALLTLARTGKRRGTRNTWTRA